MKVYKFSTDSEGMVLVFEATLEDVIAISSDGNEADFHAEYPIWEEERELRRFDTGPVRSQDREETYHRSYDSKIEIAKELGRYFRDRLRLDVNTDWGFIYEPEELGNFFTEAKSNAWNYSEYRAPSSVGLWILPTCFVVSVSQLGRTFNAREIDEKRLRNNSGGGFDLYRTCDSVIFFDNPEEASTVYMAHPVPG